MGNHKEMEDVWNLLQPRTTSLCSSWTLLLKAVRLLKMVELSMLEAMDLVEKFHPYSTIIQPPMEEQSSRKGKPNSWILKQVNFCTMKRLMMVALYMSWVGYMAWSIHILVGTLHKDQVVQHI